MFGSMLLVFISNRMISSAINEKITSHKETVKKCNVCAFPFDEERGRWA